MAEWQQKVRQELHHIREDALPAAYRTLEEAQRQGDASQNPDSFLAAEEIARLNARVDYLQEMLDGSDHRLPDGTRITVDFGDGPETMLLSASPGERDGVTAITFRSPLGTALMTASEGDRIRVGTGEVHIIRIELP